jgi:hypothetical protein
MSTYYEIKGRKDLSLNQLIKDVKEGKIKNIIICDSSDYTDKNSICLGFKTPRAKKPNAYLWVDRSGKTVDFARYAGNVVEIMLDTICAYYKLDYIPEYDKNFMGFPSYDIKGKKKPGFNQLITDVTEGKIKNIFIDKNPEVNTKDTKCLVYKTSETEKTKFWLLVHRSGKTDNFTLDGPKCSEIILVRICAYYQLEYEEHYD